MADDGQQLLISLQLQNERYLRNFERAQQQTDRRFRAIEQRSQRAARTMESSMARAVAGMNREFLTLGRTLTGALAAVASARGAQQLLDSSTRITNALKVAGLEGERLTSVYDALFASAQRNSAPLESLVTLYGRVAIVQNELGVTGAELLSFTDNVALALRVAGTDAQSASGALLQLSQAMGAGIVRAEEFNSILEGALPIAQAAAAGLKEAGGSVAALRGLVVDGKLSSEAFFRAFEAGSVILEEKVAGAESTVSQGFVRLQNVLIDVAGRMDDGTDASDRLVGVLNALTDWIATADFSVAINGVLDIGNAAITTIGHVQALGAALGALTGADQFGEWWRDQRSGATLVRDVHAATQGSGSGNAESDAAIAAALASRGAIQLPEVVVNAPKPVTPVSIADYPVGGAAGGSGGRARASGRSGGGSGGRDRAAAAAEREAEAVRDLIAELEREQSLLGATDAQRAVSDALRRAGAGATEQQKARIGELVTAIEAEKEALEGAKAAQEELKAVATDVIGGIADGLLQGASAGEILSGVLDKLMRKLIDMAVQGLVEKAFGGGGGGGGLFGILGGLFGMASPSAAVGKAIAGGAAGLFAEGGYTGQGGKHEPAGVVHRGEYVLSKKATERLGVANLEALHQNALRGFSDGGYVGSTPALSLPSTGEAGAAVAQTITLSPTINVNASGGTPEQNADLARKTSKAIENQMRALIQKELQTSMRPGGIMGRR